ncbi:MAG: hypothetical protein H3C51_04620 [Rubellimicrobium sp.]|nr:hypothetical protein [Rubellimicrobium sp.]
MSYQSTRNVRRDSRTLVGRFRGGKLAPVLAVPVRGNEGGLLSQQITLELDPIAGRMITPITGEVISVFVPVQAIDAIKDPDADFAGLTEVIREKLLSGNPLFGLEAEGEISKRLGVNPRSIGGVKKVNEMVRLAHNAAVNFLRVRKYVYATKLLANNTAITPALISQTVLDRFNAVLDPDDRINGSVQLDIPNMSLPVTFPASAPEIRSTSGGALQKGKTLSTGSSDGKLAQVNMGAETAASTGNAYVAYSGVVAALNGAEAGAVSLTDFYNAETRDRLTRTMRQIVDDNPEYGEEMVLRWAHGLSVDTGKTPFVIYQEQRAFGRSIVGATDKVGVEDDTMRSDMMLMMGFNVPIPKTELGGIVITFACLKPDETISSQPDPFLSDVWGVDNFVADELALDPVPVTIRELDSDCASGDEATVTMYTGLNQLKATYVHYGLNRHLDPNTVENKTAVWQLEVPLSVTPDTILYPQNLSHYPFADQNAEVCTYVVSSNAVLQTPMIIGPTPVEELAIIGEADIFDEE